MDKKKEYAAYRLQRANEEYETALDMLKDRHFYKIIEEYVKNKLNEQ